MDGAGAPRERPLIEALRSPACYDHACDAIELVETHLSWVLLTGPFAYKVKKPVDFGFADFSTLARRKRFCELELELNRRLAPQLYRDVVSINGPAGAPRINGPGPVLEYAVRMVQFPQRLLAAEELRAGALGARHFEALARDVAAFHATCPRADAASDFDAAVTATAAMRETLAQLRELPALATRRHEVEALAHWATQRFGALQGTLRARQQDGHVRECHGDLHLGNLVLLDDRLVPFDGIEFNPSLRWIDTASEAAFVVMDLLYRGAPTLAHRFLNAWLEAADDYGALAVLDGFLVYRALVRAKVAGLRAEQCARGAPERAVALAEARRYLALARDCTSRPRPVLAITHGVSGSGKSTLAALLVDVHGMVRIRSDVERKRLAGLAPEARSASPPDRGLYEADVTGRTYRVLEQRAARVLQAGYGVVVDAAFLRREQRQAFVALARQLRCRFRIVACEAPPAVLRRRLATRRGDASEATPAVLARQLRACEPLDVDELARAIIVRTDAPDAARRLLRAFVLRPAAPIVAPIDASQCPPARAD